MLQAKKLFKSSNAVWSEMSFEISSTKWENKILVKKRYRNLKSQAFLIKTFNVGAVFKCFFFIAAEVKDVKQQFAQTMR